MEKKKLCLRLTSLILTCLLLGSAVIPATAHADLLEKDTLFLPAACDHFGEMEDWLYSDDSEIVVFTFLRKKDPHTEMLSFAEAQEDCGLVLKNDTTTSEGDRRMELARDGATCVALMWDSSEGRLLVAYEEDTVTISRKQDESVLYLGMAEWSEAGDFVKQCGKALGTTAEKASKLVNGDRSQKLTKDDDTVVALHWYSASQILAVTFYDDSAMEKLGVPLGATDQKDETVDPNSRALPDLASFLNTKYTQDVWAYTHYVTCLVSRSDKDAIVKAVLDLLQEPRYQLKQMGKTSDSEGTHYTFEYTGKNEEVDWVRLNSGGKYHVKLTEKPYSSSQTALILYTHPEFYLKDPGTRWDGGDTPNPTPAPESDYVNHTGVYILGIMKDYFGSPKKEDYNEDRYETNYYFSFSSYPESKFKSLRSEMESLGLNCRQSSYSSDGGSKELVVKAEGGSCLKAIWRAKSKELQVTIKWEYVKKAGIFDSEDVPAERARDTDPDPYDPFNTRDCPDCDSGSCSNCGGDGEIDGLMGGIIGKQKDIKTCNKCHGGICKRCGGNGKIPN